MASEQGTAYLGTKEASLPCTSIGRNSAPGVWAPVTHSVLEALRRVNSYPSFPACQAASGPLRSWCDLAPRILRFRDPGHVRVPGSGASSGCCGTGCGASAKGLLIGHLIL